MTPPVPAPMQPFDDIPDVRPAVSQPATADGRKPLLPSDAAPTRADVDRRRLAATLLSVAWLTAQLLAFGLRKDLHELPLGYVLGLVLTPASAGILAIVLAIHAGRFSLGLRPALVVALALVCPLMFVAAGLFLPVPAAGGRAGSWGSHAFCLGVTILWASLPLVSAGLAFQRAFASSAAWRSALLGAGCGLAAAALFTLHCSIVGKAHIAFAHGGAALLIALVGGLVLSRITRA